MTQASSLHAFLSVLADHALLGRLFFASVEMAALAGIVWLIIRIRRRASPRLCSILWLLVMAKALVALAIGAPLAIISIRPPEPEPFAVAREPKFDYEDTVPSFEPEDGLPMVTVEPGPTEVTAPAGWSFSWKWSVAETISGAWLIGAILVGLYAMLNRVRLHRLVSRAMPPPAGLAERYSAAVQHLRVKRPPKLRVTHALESPALVGTLAPAILLPAWMSDKPSNAQLDWSLRHELTHWKLGDPFADFVRQIARILFFFHPVTWWASRKWEESAELACDRVMVRTESEAENYAGELYQILAQVRGRRMRPAMGGLFATRTQIGRRIAALLSNPLKSPARLGLVASLCLIAVAVISCTIGGAFVKSKREPSLDEIRRVYAARADAIRTLRLSWEGETVLLRDDTFNKGYPAEPRSLKKKGSLVIAGESNRIEREMEIWNETRQDVTPDYRMTDVFHEGVGKSLRASLSQGQISHDNELVCSVETKLMTASYRRTPEFLKDSIATLREEETHKGPRIVLGNTDYGIHYEIDEDTGRMRGTASSRTEWFLDPRRDYILTERRSMKADGEVVSDAAIEYAYEETVGYVPQLFVFERRSIADLSTVVESQMITITAFRPNEPVDPELFTLEFPLGTEVYDDRPERESLVHLTAPELDVAEWVSGESTSFAALRGKSVVLAFWDSKDDACADLVPLLNGLLRKYSEAAVETISIHSADAETNALKQFISDKSIKFRVAVDKPVKLYKGATFEKYGVKKVPAIYIIDAEGKVTYQDISLVAVEQAVKTLMEEADTEAATEGSSDSGTRTIRFPEDRSMGRLMIRDAGGQASPYDGWVDFCEARGEVRVADGKQLQLVPGRDAGKDFTPLGRLRPDDLAWINCWHVPVDDDGLRHIAGLTGLGALTLRYAPVTDEGLEHLKDLTSLVALNLFGTKVRGEGLTHLSGMRSLQILTLSSTAITDQGLAHLPEFPSLIHLGLARLDITDAGLAHIEKMHSLKELRLYDTRITVEGLISVAQLTSLEDLMLRGTRITEAGLAVLKPLESLRRFDFREVGDEGLAHLKKLKSLEAVGLSDRVTDKGLQYLSEFTSLKEISGISSNKILQVIAELPNMQSLESLGIRGDGVTDVGMECVARLEGLKSVRLSGCNVTNKGLAKLAVLRSLQSLELWNTAVTSSGLEHLAELPSLSQLWFVGFIIDKTGLAHLGDVRRLELLHLGGADVRDDDLKHLVSLHHIRSLRLQSGEITDKGIAHLSGLASLEGLDIPWGSLTDEGLGQLAKLKKLNYLLVRGKFSDRGLEYLEKLPSLGSLTLIGGEFSADALARFRRRMPSLRYLNVGQAR